jgi:membrane protease YdiL (CAAX protease family)
VRFVCFVPFVVEALLLGGALMLALLYWTTGPGQDMLHVLIRQFVWYVLGDMMLGAVVAVVFYRVLRPVVLRRLAPPPGGSRAGPLLALGGALAALLPLGLTVLVALASGDYSPASPGYAPFQPFIHGVHAPPGWAVWLFCLVQSSFEELLFRGVGLALLATLFVWLGQLSLAPPAAADGAGGAVPGAARLWFASGLAANLIIAVAFGSIHQDNPHATLYAVCNIGLAGFALGQLFWLQRNLWGACAMHTVWNAILASFGLPVSGLLARGPLLGNIRGSVDDMVTGGSFGPEASAVTTIGLLLVSLWLVWRAWRVVQAAEAAPDGNPAPVVAPAEAQSEAES